MLQSIYEKPQANNEYLRQYEMNLAHVDLQKMFISSLGSPSNISGSSGSSHPNQYIRDPTQIISLQDTYKLNIGQYSSLMDVSPERKPG